MIYGSINTAGVNIDLYKGPIGIKASGGADSSILLYNLMKHKSDSTIHIFTTGLNIQHRYNVKVATRVIEKCIRLTGNSNIEHHIKYSEDANSLFTNLELYFNNNVINMMYTGITENPPREITDKFTLPTTEKEREPCTKKEHIRGKNKKFYTPLANFNKQKIAEMYQENNLMEDLFPLTRSCEPVDRKDIGLSHCGECWWCQERKWAFGRLV